MRLSVNEDVREPPSRTSPGAACLCNAVSRGLGVMLVGLGAWVHPSVGLGWIVFQDFHQTVHILFLASDRCLRDYYDLAVARC